MRGRCGRQTEPLALSSEICPEQRCGQEGAILHPARTARCGVGRRKNGNIPVVPEMPIPPMDGPCGLCLPCTLVFLHHVVGPCVRVSLRPHHMMQPWVPGRASSTLCAPSQNTAKTRVQAMQNPHGPHKGKLDFPSLRWSHVLYENASSFSKHQTLRAGGALCLQTHR